MQESRTDWAEGGEAAHAREIEEIEFLVSFRRLQNRSRTPDDGRGGEDSADDDDDDDSQTN